LNLRERIERNWRRANAQCGAILAMALATSLETYAPVLVQIGEWRAAAQPSGRACADNLELMIRRGGQEKPPEGS